MNFFTKQKTIYIAFVLCIIAFSHFNLQAQNDYWNAQFTDITTGENIAVSDVCGGTAYQLCISPDLNSADCGNAAGTCPYFLAEVRDFCNPNEPYLAYELIPMDMGALSSIWCGTLQIPTYNLPNACPDIRISAADDCCPNLNNPPVIEIPFAGSCNSTLCCEATLGGHYFNQVTAGGLVDIPENEICGGMTVQFCTEIVYDATVCTSPIVPYECIIVTAEPRDYCNPNILGNVQYLEPTTTGLWCGTFDLPEYTTANACPDIRVMTYNTCCPDLPSNDVVEIPFAGSCNTGNPCCDAEIDIQNLFIDGTGGQNTVCEGEPFFLCANIATNAVCEENCIFATVSLINTTASGNIDFYILESNIPFNNTTAAFCNDFIIPFGTMQAGIAYELRMDVFNACCNNAEVIASIPITQNPDCVDTFCCDTAFGQPYFADANGTNIPNSDVCGGSTVQMCMTVSGSASDPASNCAECINLIATARDYCNPNAPTETVVLDLVNIGNASNLYCATITLPEYTTANACPDIRVIGSNTCCPLLDEFVTEVPFEASCNTNSCCEGDVLIENLTVYSSPIGTDNGVCEEEPFNFCFDVVNNRICDNEACLSANVELIGYTPNGIVSSILLSQGNLIDFGMLTTITWCEDLIIPAGSLQAGVTYELRLGIDDLCCGAEYIYETTLNVSPNCNTEICCATGFGEYYFSDATTGMDILASDVCGGTVVEFCTEVLYDGNCNNPTDCLYVLAEVRDFCGPTDEIISYDFYQSTNGLWCSTIQLPEYTTANACPDIRVTAVNQCCNNIAPIVMEIPFAGTCEPTDCCSGGYEISNLIIDGTGGTNEICMGETAWICGFIESNRFCDATIPCTEMNIELVVTNANGSQTILTLGALSYFQFGTNNSIYQFCEQVDIPNGNIQNSSTYEIRLTINDMCCSDSFAASIPTFITDCSPACLPEQPTNLREENLICNSVTLAWDAVPNIAQYQIAGRVFGGNWQILPPQTTTARTFNSNIIQPNTAYQWTVRTICEDGSMSDWIQPVRTFVTPVCRATLPASLEAAKLSVYPNPAPQQTDIYLDIEMLDNDNNIMMKMYDVMGKIMIEEIYDANTTKATVNINALPTGVYIVELNNGEQRIIEKLMVK